MTLVSNTYVTTIQDFALVSGGFLLLHDYDPSRKDLGPNLTVENRVQPSPLFKFVGLFDSIWVGQKV